MNIPYNSILIVILVIISIIICGVIPTMILLISLKIVLVLMKKPLEVTRSADPKSDDPKSDDSKSENIITSNISLSTNADSSDVSITNVSQTDLTFTDLVPTDLVQSCDQFDKSHLSSISLENDIPLENDICDPIDMNNAELAADWESKYRFKSNDPDILIAGGVPMNMLSDFMGCSGDNSIMKKMSHVSSMNKRALTARSNFSSNSIKKYFEEELRDHSNRIWWDNQDLEQAF